MVLSAPVLETKRLLLRPLVAGDADGWGQRALEHYAKHGFGLLAVEDRTTGEFFGNVGPTMQRIDDVDEIELGWSITPDRSRQGIATEAAKACRDHVFEVVGADHVISLILPQNEPSAGVARKLGMTVWKQSPHGSVQWLHNVWRLDTTTRQAG